MIFYKIILFLTLLNLLFIAYFFVRTKSEWFKLIISISKKTLLIVLGMCVVNVLLIMFFFPLFHHYFIDESFYMSAAKNIIQERTITLDDAAYEKQVGWPVLISIFFLFFGIDNMNAIYFSIFLSSISVFVFFIFTFILFKSEKIALISSLFYLFLPLRLSMSASAETITSSVLFSLLALTCFLLYFSLKDFKLQLLAWFLFVYAIQIRLENVLLIIPIVYLFYRKKVFPKRKEIGYLLVTLPFFISFVVQYFILRNFYIKAYSNHIVFYGFEQIAFKMYSLFSSLQNPVLMIYAVMLVLGLIISIKNKNYFLLYCAFPFILFYFLYNYSAPFHAITGVCLMISFTGMILSKLSKKLILIIAILFMTTFFVTLNVNADNYFVLETTLVHDISIPQECKVISPRTIFVNSVHNLNMYSLDEFFETYKINPEVFTNLCTYFVEDMLCFKNYYNSTMQKNCNELKNEFIHDTKQQFTIGNITFTSYELNFSNVVSKKQFRLIK